MVRLPENVGFGSGHNTVLPQLDSVYHFVVNPDITLDDDAVSKLCAWMDAHPDVVMATPRLLFPDGAEQYTAKRRPSFLALLARQIPLPFLKGVERHYLMQDEDLSRPQEIEFCTGCFFVMRTEAFRRMGGFDEGYFMYVEDADITRKAQEYGKVMYVPEAPCLSCLAPGHKEKVEEFLDADPLDAPLLAQMGFPNGLRGGVFSRENTGEACIALRMQVYSREKRKAKEQEQ